MAAMTTKTATKVAAFDCEFQGEDYNGEKVVHYSRYTLRTDGKILYQWRDSDGHLRPATLTNWKLKDAVPRTSETLERILQRRGYANIKKVS